RDHREGAGVHADALSPPPLFGAPQPAICGRRGQGVRSSSSPTTFTASLLRQTTVSKGLRGGSSDPPAGSQSPGRVTVFTPTVAVARVASCQECRNPSSGDIRAWFWHRCDRILTFMYQPRAEAFAGTYPAHCCRHDHTIDSSRCGTAA